MGETAWTLESNGQGLVLAQVTVTEYHRLGGLKNRRLFFTLLETGKFKIQVPANWLLGNVFSRFADSCLLIVSSRGALTTLLRKSLIPS